MSDYALSHYMSIKLRERLADWYAVNRRSMPWRETKDPYRIWLSEVIMQQTRVAQGTPYYLRFLEAFPNVHALAMASQDQILKLWEGLGYYSRARNMHKAAQIISKEYLGNFPDNYKDMLKLPGVGPYTAAAISSISFSEMRAVVDGNVVRVLSRLRSIPFRYDKPADKAIYDALALQLLHSHCPGDHNQAMMELGALVCTPRNPDCESCPFQQACTARKSGQVEDYPPAKEKIKKRTRYFHYLMISSATELLIRKRTSSDIWQGLYELPYLEQLNRPSKKEWLKLFSELGLDVVKVSIPKKLDYTTKHVLSHQNIEGRFYEVKLKSIPRIHLLSDGREKMKDVLLIKKSTLSHYAYPRILNRFFEAFL